MEKTITDVERIKTLQALFENEGIMKPLPFSKEKLDYLKPLSLRYNQLIQEDVNGGGIHSLTMLRQMIDEILMEITAQISWSLNKCRVSYKMAVLRSFGLAPWSRKHPSSIIPSANVA